VNKDLNMTSLKEIADSIDTENQDYPMGGNGQGFKQLPMNVGCQVEITGAKISVSPRSGHPQLQLTRKWDTGDKTVSVGAIWLGLPIDSAANANKDNEAKSKTKRAQATALLAFLRAAMPAVFGTVSEHQSGNTTKLIDENGEVLGKAETEVYHKTLRTNIAQFCKNALTDESVLQALVGLSLVEVQAPQKTNPQFSNHTFYVPGTYEGEMYSA
jgi:hypothetical protein